MAVKPSDLEPTEAQPITDADVMVGGPGQESPSEQAPAAHREITINGRKFAVDPDLAETMTQREKDFDRKLQETSGELGRLRKFYQENQPKTPTVERKGYDTLLFEDPNGAVSRLKEEIRQEYIQEKKLERFWDSFYRSNKDLDRDHDEFLVQAVLNRNLNDLASLREEEAREKLAELARREILRYQQKAGVETEVDGSIPRTVVARPSVTTPRAPATETDNIPNTLTEAIRRAQQRKRAGRAA